MQIHELNNYNGNLDSSAYLAVDNGSDTGKVSTAELLADTNAAVSQLDTVLNGRIDNIVAGGEAPSASEIVDARYGADGVTYHSLGAAIRDQVTDLKSDINDIDYVYDKESEFHYSDNILPPDSESGYWDPSTGEAVENASRIRCVNYIAVNPDVQLFIRVKNKAWGGSKITVIQFDSNNGVIRSDTHISDNYVYLRPNCAKVKMYVNNTTPALADICFRYTAGEYVAYEETEILTRTLKDSALPADVSKIKDSISYHVSANLFDKNSITVGKYINASDGAEASASNLCCAYIPISESGTYTTMCVRSYFGSTNAAKAWLYDSELAPIKYVTGTLADKNLDVTENTFTISEEDITTVKYVGVTYRLIDIDEMMFVKGSYPASYIMYENYSLFNGLDIEETNVQNHLYKKVIAFDGDSICNASSETAETWHRGWAYRVGDNNHMLWHNYGVGGGTITNGLFFGGNPTYCISKNFDEIIAQNPELDYFIFDGGTNDADIIADDSAIGSIDYTNFSGPFDDTTFVGAFEKLIYTALNNYPNLKIGYIVAPKMGLQTNFKTCRRYTFFELSMKICDKWGVPYINLWDESPLNPKIPSMYDSSLTNAGNIARGSLYVDGQHLTKEGYDAIFNAINCFVKSL